MELYLILLNAAGLVLMFWDKLQAKRGGWRIPEATLMAVAAMGGSVGVWLGMYLFRHKTRKPRFYVGVPAVLLIQIAVWYFLR